jgi:ATP-binding cassette subfamily B protein
MEEGYETIVKPDKISAGMKQRMCLARMLIRDHRVLLLDEATSALDSKTEVAVFEHLKSMLADPECRLSCLITVTHRTETLHDATRVYTMGEGGELKLEREEVLPSRTGGTRYVVAAV